MDIALRQIISKAAGTYFIVTDASQVPTIEAENKMRLFFINSEIGPTNTLFKFAKGDTLGFSSVFGKASRAQEKKGNFSHSTCLRALTAGPIAVVNLREFISEDKVGYSGLNPNRLLTGSGLTDYTKVFNTNGFWTPKKTNLENFSTIENNLLQFANVNTNRNLSIFVVKSTNYDTLTSEGENSLQDTKLEIPEYPLLLTKPETKVKDTFVDVYIFNKDFTSANTNPYYGHLFNGDNKIDLENLNVLASITEAGFATKITGSIIPTLKSEDAVDISIDVLINQYYMQYGVICNINEDIFESTTASLLDFYGLNIYDADGAFVEDITGGRNIYSHVGPTSLTKEIAIYPPLVPTDLELPNYNLIDFTNYSDLDETEKTFIGAFEQGLHIGDKILGADGNICEITAMEIISTETVIYDVYKEFEYTKVKYIYSGNLYVDGTTKIIKYNSFVENGTIIPSTLKSYVLRAEQLLDGTATRQNTILDMMNNPGIVKGIVGTNGIRYVVDCFKSFIEPSYKYQYGQLMLTLDNSNRFVRAIINEPFIEDLQNSTNPLFRTTPMGNFDWSYVPLGGNKTYSTKLLTKFSAGADMCFFYGPGDIVNTVTKGLSGQISNLFYLKRYAFDVVANESGYIDNVTELEYNIDDNERAYCERFRYNPIINIDGLYTIFGNNSGTSIRSAQQQIQNSELLAFIKESLYNLSKKEAFKKGNYDDYLRTETESINFMTSLVLAGAVKSDFIAICNATNNTTEIQKQRIKLVHIEYTPVDSLEKVVFDIKIN